MRSHDMWRNGFRTRAKLGIDRFDPGRRRIMDLHKQMFSEGTDSPKVNMATPVELPGDKVLSAPHLILVPDHADSRGGTIFEAGSCIFDRTHVHPAVQ